MVTLTTNGIKIEVETFFQDEYSHPINQEFMFAYRITITNQGKQTVRLLKREWRIFDSCGEIKEVEGVGVVGKQPILKPSESHQYVSGCSLRSEMGNMKGAYVMQNMDNRKIFKVKIPRFEMTAPLKLN